MSARPSPVSLPGEAGSPLLAPPKPHFGAGVGAVGGTAPPSGPGRPRRAAGRARRAPNPREGDARGGMLAPIAPGYVCPSVLSTAAIPLQCQHPRQRQVPPQGPCLTPFGAAYTFPYPVPCFFFSLPNLQVPSSARCPCWGAGRVAPSHLCHRCHLCHLWVSPLLLPWSGHSATSELNLGFLTRCLPAAAMLGAVMGHDCGRPSAS